MTAPAHLRVLVCEDSRTYAAAFRRMLEQDGAISVVGVCATAEEAVAALPALRPDLVTMDLELPGMGGLEAVEEIMSCSPVPILVLSAHVGSRTERAAAALAAGALEAISKDDLDLREPTGAAAVAFRRRLEILGRARVIRHPRARLDRRVARAARPRVASAIGICASTGGPQALARVLEALPGDFSIPVLVVQHMSVGFVSGLADWLDRRGTLRVRVARAGDRVVGGVWLAPDGAHLSLEPSGVIALHAGGAVGAHRPSGDVLLESIAAVAGRAAVAVVLSGMGRDGAAGAAAVHRSGGLAIAQDGASAAVNGMPRAAIERGVDLVLAPDEIGVCLRALRHAPLAGGA